MPQTLKLFQVPYCISYYAVKNIDQLKTTWAAKTLDFLQILASQHFLSQVPPTFHPCLTLNDDDAMKCSWHFVPWSSFGSFKTKDRIVCRKNWGGGFKRSKFYPSSVFCKKKPPWGIFWFGIKVVDQFFLHIEKGFDQKSSRPLNFSSNFFVLFSLLLSSKLGDRELRE